MTEADRRTAAAFATSWNNLPPGSVYTREQFEDWLSPLTADDVSGRSVLELGCGNGSLLVHLASWEPSSLVGVDLGDSVDSAEHNMRATEGSNWRITRADLTTFESAGFDLVVSIGVLHHLAEPLRGFEAVLRNTRPGGRFHCWVYAHEGNAVVRMVVEPLRKICSRLPWWLTKYLVATPLVVPYFVYAKTLDTLAAWLPLRFLPLYDYSRWIARRELAFFRHVAFDQLVTPQTVYLRRATIESWLSIGEVEPNSAYIVFRNGNSWKLGGRRRGGKAPSTVDQALDDRS